MKKLVRKAQFLDMIDCDGEDYTVYINPTMRETVEIIKDTGNRDIRAILGKDNNLYVWSSDILHSDILNKCKKIKDGIHIETNGKEINIYIIPGYDLNQFIQAITDNLSKLNNIGITSGSKIAFVDTTLYNAQSYKEYKDIKCIGDILTLDDNNKVAMIHKRLIKKSEFLDMIKNDNKDYSIYINPTHKEVRKIVKETGFNSIRGIISNDGNVYIWSSEVLHSSMLTKCNKIKDGLHFTYIINRDELEIFAMPNDTPETLMKIFNKSMHLLMSIGINNSTNIDDIDTYYYDAPRYVAYDNFSILEDILNYDGEGNELENETGLDDNTNMPQTAKIHLQNKKLKKLK